MEQLLLHLLGDYVTQTDWMAQNKTRSKVAALLHAAIYTLPFLLLTQSTPALFCIFFSHYLIDHYRLARYVVFAKNWLTSPHKGDPISILWSFSSKTGYQTDVPEHLHHIYGPNHPMWMATWLMIIADNMLHLGINYACLRWL
jgi:hypothetical protein